MPVGRAQAEIDAAEFAEWMAYYSLEPWGQERGDLRAGIVASVIANTQRGKGKAFTPQDFMPQFEAPKRKKKKQTPQEMQSILRLFTVASGGTINGKSAQAEA